MLNFVDIKKNTDDIKNTATAKNITIYIARFHVKKVKMVLWSQKYSSKRRTNTKT